ncbi:hypothetical protein LPJ74_005402 [Coemansia sp. RSA 1843]|nr:hypothetical protein LPJ74_005402 [Coemansia sp. RSA 1843]
MLVPLKLRTSRLLIKRIERAVVDEQLLAQVWVANPQEQIEKEDVKDTMAASIWFSVSNGKFHAMNSFRKPTERDTSERSLGYKLLLGNIPVMKPEAAWYLQAYPKPEMQHCSRDHTDEASEKTREHFLECTIGAPKLPAPQMGSALAAWTNKYVRKWASIVGIMQTDRRNALKALRQDMHPRQRMARDPTATMLVTMDSVENINDIVQDYVQNRKDLNYSSFVVLHDNICDVYVLGQHFMDHYGIEPIEEGDAIYMDFWIARYRYHKNMIVYAIMRFATESYHNMIEIMSTPLDIPTEVVGRVDGGSIVGSSDWKCSDCDCKDCHRH